MKTVRLDALFDQAGGEPIGRLDVRDAVMAQLNRPRHFGCMFSRTLVWMSAASSAAAAMVMVAAVMAWQQNGDSVTEILNVVNWVAQ